jgi:hypothetical protein
MSKTIFLAALMAAAPGAAFAQDWVVEPVPPPAVIAPPAAVVEPAPIVAPRVYDYVEERPAPAYGWYVERPAPLYRRVVVGDVLPPSVAFYPAPAEYGVTEYRYAIVNHEPLLVEPRTRRVVEVLD